MATRKPMSARAVALKHGFRSGLEEDVSKALTDAGIPFTYEEVKIKYLQPSTERMYTPDFFLLENGIIIETKGRFLIADRKKHMLIKRQHPQLDIRFVFSNSKQKISKGSRTSYADWCNKNGFLYSDKEIPVHWLKRKGRVKAMKVNTYTEHEDGSATIEFDMTKEETSSVMEVALRIGLIKGLQLAEAEEMKEFLDKDKKEWVGLTEDGIREIFASCGQFATGKELAMITAIIRGIKGEA